MENENKKNSLKEYLTKRNIIVLICILLLITLFALFFNQKKGIDSITLEANTYGIYEWEYDIKDKSIVKFIEKKKTGEKEDLTVEQYYFEALKPGKTNITFTLVNTNNKSFLDEKNYTVSVDKNLKLSIKKQ